MKKAFNSSYSSSFNNEINLVSFTVPRIDHKVILFLFVLKFIEICINVKLHKIVKGWLINSSNVILLMFKKVGQFHKKEIGHTTCHPTENQYFNIRINRISENELLVNFHNIA